MIAKEISSIQIGAIAVTSTTKGAMMTITDMKTIGTTLAPLQAVTPEGHRNIALDHIGAENMKGSTHEYNVIVIRDIEITYHFVSVLMKITKDPHC